MTHDGHIAIYRLPSWPMPACRFKTFTSCWPAIIAMLLATPAQAAGIAGIGGATVNKDQLTVHWRQSYGIDNDRMNQDHRWRERLVVDYGFTDDIASGIYIQGDRRKNREMELESLMWDTRVELANVKEDGYYSGFRIRYTYKDGDKKPDNLHIRAIAGVPYGNWEFRINPIFYTDIGPDSRAGLGIELRSQVTYGYTPGHRVGLESYHTLGRLRDLHGYSRTSHDMGIVFTGHLMPEWNYETGYAYGITESAPDHTFKLFIVRNF